MLYTLDNVRQVVSSIEGEWRRYKALGEGAFRQLRDDEIGRTGPGDGNSVAVIVWHISGNLKSRFQDFLIADGEKPWRKRDTEFEPRPDITRAEMLEKWNDSIEAYNQAIALEPESVPAYLGVAASYRHLNQLEEATNTYLKLIEFKPKNATAHYQLGLLYLIRL